MPLVDWSKDDEPTTATTQKQPRLAQSAPNPTFSTGRKKDINFPSVVEVERYLRAKQNPDVDDLKLIARLAKDGKNFERYIIIIKEMLK